MQYYYEGRYADSAEMQLKATELAPNDHRAWGRLAETYRNMGAEESLQLNAYATAIRLAEPMLEISNQDWRTSGMLATYYVHSGRADDARTMTETALSISKRNPEALLYAAQVFIALGDEESTLQSLEEMVDRNDSFRNYAGEDPDFRMLHGNERFENVISP